MSIQQVEQNTDNNIYLSAPPPCKPPVSPKINHLNLVFIMLLLLEGRLFCLSPIYRTAAAEVTSRVPVYS